MVQLKAVVRRASCLPDWLRSQRKPNPAGEITRQARLPALLNVGVGQNEQPFADMRCADFRR